MANLAQFKKFYRIFSYVSLAASVLGLLLILRKSPPPNVTYDPAAAARVEKKFAAAEQAKAAGETAQVQLNGAELNSYLLQNLQLERSSLPGDQGDSIATPAGGASSAAATTDARGAAAAAGADPATIEQAKSTVKDVRIDLVGDLVKAYVVFDFHGKDLSLELDGHLNAEDGYLKFQPVSGKLGSLPLPQSTLHAAVERIMASPENREKLRLPPDISDIQILNGQVVVSYK
jgi:hypothetical protein